MDNEVDTLVKQELVAFKNKVLEAVRTKHPYVVNIFDTVFANKENYVGLQVTEDSRVIGEYTIYVRGIRVVAAEAGKLDPLVKHPLLDLTFKPYFIMEKRVLKEIMADETVMNEPVAALQRYLPAVTIKFLK